MVHEAILVIALHPGGAGVRPGGKPDIIKFKAGVYTSNFLSPG
jgi:hypothetical protein